MKAFGKSIIIILILSWHISLCWLARLFSKNPNDLRKFFIEKVSRHSRWTKRMFEIETKVEGIENFKEGHNYLIVSNHMSYLDAILVSSLRSTTFVTSKEMQAYPFLGTIVELGGCIFVDRISKENIHHEIRSLEETLKQGFHVTIFPEATSTNGSALRAFKRPLFSAAINAKKSVLPLVLQYESIDGEKVTIHNRDLLCWYGSMDFAPHFFSLTKHDRIKITIKILPEIPIIEGTTREELAEQAFLAIQSNYRPIGET